MVQFYIWYTQCPRYQNPLKHLFMLGVHALKAPYISKMLLVETTASQRYNIVPHHPFNYQQYIATFKTQNLLPAPPSFQQIHCYIQNLESTPCPTQYFSKNHCYLHLDNYVWYFLFKPLKAIPIDNISVVTKCLHPLWVDILTLLFREKLVQVLFIASYMWNLYPELFSKIPT